MLFTHRYGSYGSYGSSLFLSRAVPRQSIKIHARKLTLFLFLMSFDFPIPDFLDTFNNMGSFLEPLQILPMVSIVTPSEVVSR